MTALLFSLFEHIWPYLIAGLGAALTLLLALWRAYAKGRQAERNRQAQAESKARDVRDAVQNDIGAMPPDKVRSELSKRAAK